MSPFTPLEFKPVAPQSRHAKVLLIGEAGVGKTHAALTFPSPAVVDAEGSVDWFSDRFKFVAVPTKSYEDVRQLVKAVNDRRVKCETLIIDSLTSIYNGLVNAATVERLAQGSDDLRPLDWGRIKRKFSSLLDELYHQLPVHVVCVGWIKPEYAKAGDKVGNRTVGPNDLVKIGETFDGDRKTMYAFDFVFKILGNDGKKARAQVVKSRSGSLAQGQIIENFSWATIKALVPSGSDTSYHGMSDEEQEVRDLTPHRTPPEPVRRGAPPIEPLASIDEAEADAVKLGISAIRALCQKHMLAVPNTDGLDRGQLVVLFEELREKARAKSARVPVNGPESPAKAPAPQSEAPGPQSVPRPFPGVHAEKGEAPAARPPQPPLDTPEIRDRARKALHAFCSGEKIDDATRHRISYVLHGRESSKDLDTAALRSLRDTLARWVAERRPDLATWEGLA